MAVTRLNSGSRICLCKVAYPHPTSGNLGKAMKNPSSESRRFANTELLGRPKRPSTTNLTKPMLYADAKAVTKLQLRRGRVAQTRPAER